jgi:hypothetical protein
MDGCRMKLSHGALSDALLHILGEQLPAFEFRTIGDDEGLFKTSFIGKSRTPHDLRRDAAILAAEVESNYDRTIECELGTPFDDDA